MGPDEFGDVVVAVLVQLGVSARNFGTVLVESGVARTDAADV